MNYGVIIQSYKVGTSALLAAEKAAMLEKLEAAISAHLATLKKEEVAISCSCMSETCCHICDDE